MSPYFTCNENGQLSFLNKGKDKNKQLKGEFSSGGGNRSSGIMLRTAAAVS